MLIEVNLWLNHHGPTLLLALAGLVAVAFGLLLTWRLFRWFDTWLDPKGGGG